MKEFFDFSKPNLSSNQKEIIREINFELTKPDFKKLSYIKQIVQIFK